MDLSRRWDFQLTDSRILERNQENQAYRQISKIFSSSSIFIYLLIVYFYCMFSLYIIVVFNKNTLLPSCLKGGKKVRHSAIDLRFGNTAYNQSPLLRWSHAFPCGLSPAPFGGCLVLLDFALRATWEASVISGEFLLYFTPEETHVWSNLLSNNL